MSIQKTNSNSLTRERNRLSNQIDIILEEMMKVEYHNRPVYRSLEAAYKILSRKFNAVQNQILDEIYASKFETGEHTRNEDGSISVDLKLEGRYESWMQ